MTVGDADGLCGSGDGEGDAGAPTRHQRHAMHTAVELPVLVARGEKTERK